MQSPAAAGQGHQHPQQQAGYGFAPAATPYYACYNSWTYPTPYNALPGSVFNSGGNRNGSGTQENGDVEVGNRQEKSGGVAIDRIGGNHANTNGQQRAGHVSLGNISTA